MLPATQLFTCVGAAGYLPLDLAYSHCRLPRPGVSILFVTMYPSAF